MKFSTKEDVEAPIEYVFGQVTDFDAFERMILRRGADLQRIDSLSEPGVGMSWKARLDVRGKPRDITAQITRYDPSSDLCIKGESDGFEIDGEVELVALSPGRTRMRVSFELVPRTLSARLLVQSAKLARRNLTERYKDRVARYALDMENRFKSRMA